MDCAPLTCTGGGGGGVHSQNSKEEINSEDIIWNTLSEVKLNSKEEINSEDIIWNTLSEVKLKISKRAFMLRQGKKL